MKGISVALFFLLTCKTGISQKLYDSAVKTYYKGELSNAIRIFTNCINNKEKVSLAYMYRGSAQAFLGNFEEAFKDLNISRNLDSITNDKIDYYFGKTCLLNKEYGKALQHFIKSIEKIKDEPDRFDAIATAEAGLGNFDKAIEFENYAIKLDSTQMDYFVNRGYAKMKSGFYESSIPDLSKVLAVQNDSKAYFDRGCDYLALKMYEKALNDYNSALLISPANAEILYFRGTTFYYLNMKKESCADFQRSAGLGFSESSKMMALHCQ